jgi:hypothetical protein
MKAAAKQAAFPPKTPSEVISMQKKAEKMTKGKGDKKCPSGQILRSAYISHSRKPVPYKCIEKRGESDQKKTQMLLFCIREGLYIMGISMLQI